jgi:LuxR family transcriptional regulator, maltose regulon positive regulatory protein
MAHAPQLALTSSEALPSALAPEHLRSQLRVAGDCAPSAGTDGIVARPRLFERINQGGRVKMLSAPAGAGKTSLLRSWLRETDLESRAAWVALGARERDPQRFWRAVIDALRHTKPGLGRVREAPAASEFDGWAIVEQLLADLDSLDERLWLVLDDLDELRASETLRQLELLLARAHRELRFAIATRHDLRLGLHRARMEGELTELDAADLRFTLDEARALFEASGVELSNPALERLLERTEGWAGGLRLAALSLSGHPDPDRFADEFSGSERGVADYLLAEVLERQTEEARALLLRTSILKRVSAPLADRLTGRIGSLRILQELEQANAFVMSLNATRSWFRYHPFLAELLELELRRTAPDEVAALHRTAATWLDEHGYPIEAARHAHEAEDWSLAVRILSDHWHDLALSGEFASACEQLADIPAERVTSNPELAALVAAAELARGSLDDADGHLALAEQGLPSIAAERRGRLEIMLAFERLALGRRRGDLAAVREHAVKLSRCATASAATRIGVGEEFRAVALVTVGAANVWGQQLAAGEQDLDEGLALAKRIGQPYLEVTALAHLAIAALHRSAAAAKELSGDAIECAQRHGWSDQPVAATAYAARASLLVSQSRLGEAERWLSRGERAMGEYFEPATGFALQAGRGRLEIARGRDAEALAAFRDGERLAGALVPGHPIRIEGRALLLHALLRLGQTDRVEAALAAMDEQERQNDRIRIVRAALRLAQHDDQAAQEELAPLLGSTPTDLDPIWVVLAWLLEAQARQESSDLGGAGRALERALDRAEPDGLLWPFLLRPAPDLLERHRRTGSAHAALIGELLGLLGGAVDRPSPDQTEPPAEPLSESEKRVLRYLPTNLSAPQIATELYLSPHTINTHIRHVYTKLGTHTRAEAVERARALGLLAPAAYKH